MEEFLQKWADERVAQVDENDPKTRVNIEETTHEVEQGLVAFQTLLEYHTDIAFDFFEAWSLRNIFVIPPDLPVVLPHQEGLDLTVTPEQEQEAMDEVEELRKRLDGQRKLNRLLTRANRTSARQLSQAEARLSQLSSLTISFNTPGSMLNTLQELPPKFLEMYRTLSSLPPLETLPTAVDLSEPGKRQWETSKTGYMNWVLGRLLVKGETKEGMGHGAVDKIDLTASEIGTGEELRCALNAVGAIKRDLAAVLPPEGDVEDRMEE